MRNNKQFIKYFFFLLFFIPFAGWSQQPVQQRNPEDSWNKANDLWEKQKYSAAQKQFGETAEYFDAISDPRVIDCEFYEAYCGLKLYNRDSEFRFKTFLKKYPEDVRAHFIYFLLGKYNFERKKYKRAINYFNALSAGQLESNNLPEYYYYFGYSRFMTDDYTGAKTLFTHNTDPNDPFYDPATYYLAYIDYLYEDYDAALAGFGKLEEAEGFSTLVPYYIAQIYFLQGRYQEVIKIAVPRLENASAKHKYEMARLIAESYFREEQFDKALTYFELYFGHSKGFSRDDYYAYGYTLYQNKAYEKAIVQFNKAVDVDDELSQTALLNLGDCFLKTNQIKSAQTAFSKSAQMGYNREITEEAFFNYAKTSYQLSFDPYDRAIQAFEKYLDSYPNSARKDEAYLFLLDVYIKTKNYLAAVEIIDKIYNPDEQVKRAFQLSVFNLAVDHFLQENYDESQRLFQLTGKYDYDKKLTAEADFWLGELKFRKKNFRGAISSYQQFLNAPQAKSSANYADGYYGMGYAFLKLRSHYKSAEYFTLFIDNYRGNDNKKHSDALLRLGDLQFIRKAYEPAISNFKKALALSSYDRDYALFQIAMSYGYMDKPQEKIKGLNRLIDEIPESVYIPQALFELGVTYFDTGNYSQALQAFAHLEETSPSSRLVAQSRLKRGLIYIRTSENEKAEAEFLSVINDYPNTQEASEALISLKEVNLEAFTQIARSSGYSNVSKDDVDAANFEEAEAVYLNGNYPRAAFLFGHYLNGFPNGRFRQNAHYYKGDCHVRLDQPDSAVVEYKALLDIPGGPYYENALYMSAYLSASVGNEMEAYDFYKMLYNQSENKQYRFDALNYLMFTGFKLADFENAVDWAKEIRNDEKPDESLKQKALLIEMKSLVQLNRKPEAFTLIDEANTELRDETSAEIWFLKARWLYEKGNYKEAEDALFFLLQNFASFAEWRARGFILLGDVYAGMGDHFQAKATWQSVIDHHKGAELVAVAQQKLDALVASEKPELQSEKDNIEIDYNPTEKKVENISIGSDTIIENISDTTATVPVDLETVKDSIPDKSDKKEDE